MGRLAKRPFGGPEAVLAYLARYTHRVAISNSRLIALHDGAVAFKWKDYRLEGRDRTKTMTLDAAEFIRRFSCTCCQPDSIAFAITACSPAAPALTTSPSRAGCSRLPPSKIKTATSMTSTKPNRPLLFASMPMLWQPHDCHRDLRTRRRTARLFAHLQVDTS
jgi:hypothetical protein